MKHKLVLFFFLAFACLSNLSVYSQPAINLQTVASGFVKPLQIVNAGDSRLFIVEQDGKIKILHIEGTITTFLNIDSKVNSTGGEQGLLGLAFHPNYTSNGYFYVNYINNSGNTNISRFRVSSSDPDVADVSSELVILTINQPYPTHNGGDLNFGLDGYLYIAMGDGGGSGDPGNRAQDLNVLLGKMLRINVNAGSPYSIPPSNPFVGTAGADEIWAYGLRNPWRFSFDRLTGDMWIGDVGQGAWEEIDFQAANDAGGDNYGWRCYEGTHPYNTSSCNLTAPFTFPIFEYPHEFSQGGFSVTGGFVYRGVQYPDLYGLYIFCDYVTGNFWTTVSNGTGNWNTIQLNLNQPNIATFGEDVKGELYAANLSTGEIYHLAGCGGISLSFNVTNAAAPNVSNGAINLSVNGGSGPFTYSWSNGATTQDISGLAAGTYSVTVTNSAGCTVVGGAIVDNNCGPATDIMITNITSQSATVSWDNSGATSYKVIYKQPGSPSNQINTTGTVVNLTGLSPSTFYTVKIRNKCPGAPGGFLASSSFTTDPAKFAVLSSLQIPKIYPNPGSGSFIIENAKDVQKVSVLDATGKVLINFTSDEKEIISFDLSSFAPGIYLVRMVEKNEYVQTEKLILEH